MNQDLVEICLTTFFGVHKFKNALAMRLIFFFENVANSIKISIMQKNLEKYIFLSEIIASEHLAINCLYQGDNTCDRQSMP